MKVSELAQSESDGLRPSNPAPSQDVDLTLGFILKSTMSFLNVIMTTAVNM